MMKKKILEKMMNLNKKHSTKYNRDISDGKEPQADIVCFCPLTPPVGGQPRERECSSCTQQLLRSGRSKWRGAVQGNSAHTWVTPALLLAMATKSPNEGPKSEQAQGVGHG